MPPCVPSALICCYTGCDLTTCPPKTILCSGMIKLIALEANCCLQQGKEMMPIGMDKEYKGDGKICKLGAGIFDIALFKPDVKSLIVLDGDLLCLSVKGSLPFGGPLPAPICSGACWMPLRTNAAPQCHRARACKALGRS